MSAPAAIGPPDRDLILGLESRLVNAWPAFEVELAEGWLSRFAEGYSKRANSATPIQPGARLSSDSILAIMGGFERRGIAPCFRLTGVEDPGSEALLEAAGLVDYDPSLGMVAEIAAPAEPDPGLIVEPFATPAWIAAAAASYGGDKSNAGILGRIVGLIRQPAAFATLRLDGEDAAFGLAVAERGHVGLYDIVVAPGRRGKGLGRTLVSGLMAWGYGKGARHAYLQMRETNEVAHALYRSLGFRTLYRYRHRVLPGRAPAPADGAPLPVDGAVPPAG